MEYQITTLDEMIIVSADGKTRDAGLEDLKQYLATVNLEAKDYFFIEVFSGGKVSGAMALALVDEKPEKNRKFRTSVLEAGKYLVMEMSYEEYCQDNKNGSSLRTGLNNYLKEQGYSIAGFPFFKFIPDTTSSDIRVYIPVK